MKIEKIPQMMNPKDYKIKISKIIGKKVELNSINGGKTVKTVKGIIQYASNTIFGIKVEGEKQETFILSFPYVDLFTNKIVLNVEED